MVLARHALCSSALLTSSLLLSLVILFGCQGAGTGKRAETTPREPRTVTIPGSTVSFDLVWIPDGEFWIGKTEVTWDAYLFYADFGEERRSPKGVDAMSRPSKPLDDITPFDRDWGLGSRPAVGMSRQAATRYCEWLSKKTGHTYRLPTEAEWMAACGPDSPQAKTDVAWFAANSEEMTHPVGTKSPNALGVHDMLGNLWEYCSDPFSSSEPERAVLRGGAWDTEASDLNREARLGFEDDWILADPNVPAGVWWVPDGSHLGFRIVCEPNPVSKN